VESPQPTGSKTKPSWKWLGWRSPTSRLSVIALGLGALGWLSIILGGYIWNPTDAGQAVWVVGNGLNVVSLVLGIKAFRTRERWIAGFAIVVSAYTGVLFPLWLLGLPMGAST
jgi:hypothetical protein